MHLFQSIVPRGLAIGLAAAALLAIACVPPPSEDVLSEFEDERLVKKTRAAGALRIGIPTEIPYVGVTDEPNAHALGPTGEGMGFAGEVGTWVARELRVRPEFVPGRSEELLALLDRRQADLVFPLIPITERATNRITFSNPYYIAHQRLLVSTTSGTRSIDDLHGKRVCAAIDPKTEVRPEMLNPALDVVEASNAGECTELLIAGEVEAVTSADIYLLSLLSEGGRYQIVGDRLSTEGYGAAVEPGASRFADFVDAVIYDAIQDGRWSKSYARWIAPLTQEKPEPPRLTAEEAAALFPIRAPVSKQSPLE